MSEMERIDGDCVLCAQPGFTCRVLDRCPYRPAPPIDDTCAYVHTLISTTIALVDRTDEQLRQEVADIYAATRMLEARIAALKQEALT